MDFGTLIGEYVTWYSFLENYLTESIKLKKCLLFDSAVSYLGIFFTELLIGMHKEGRSKQFIWHS